jgi:3-dehydroquinate dehydratase
VQNKIPAVKPGITTYTSLAKSDFTEWTDAIHIGAHAFPHTYFAIHKTVRLNEIAIMESHSKTTNI